jgi:hypothetical protein
VQRPVGIGHHRERREAPLELRGELLGGALEDGHDLEPGRLPFRRAPRGGRHPQVADGALSIWQKAEEDFPAAEIGQTKGFRSEPGEREGGSHGINWSDPRTERAPEAKPTSAGEGDLRKLAGP